MLFGSITSQCTPHDSGLGVLRREGNVFVFEEARQAYGIMWNSAGPEQELLDFFSLSTLIPLLLEDNKKRIALTIQQLQAPWVDNASAAPVEHTPPTKPPVKKKSKKSSATDKAAKKRMAEIPTSTKQTQPNKQQKLSRTKETKETDEPKTIPSRSVDAPKKSPKAKPRTNRGKFTISSNTPAWPPVADPISQRDGAKRKRNPDLSALASTIQSATTLSPNGIELRDNHTFNHALDFGAIRVMSMYSVDSDPYPLAAYRGVSSGGLFEFHTCPNKPLALLTRSNVSVYVPHQIQTYHVCAIRNCTHHQKT